MNKSWHVTKVAVRILLGLIFIADVALGGFLYWQSQQTSVRAYSQVATLRMQAKKLHADVERGDRIRQSLTPAGEACEKFYNATFLDSATGYSAIQADLSSIASKAGVHASSVSFKPKEFLQQGVTEISISEDIEGDYPSVLQFINGLEISDNFYLLRGLTLDSTSSGGASLKLQLDLATYFRK
ncbi:MAG TPA: GspMb/PilO family protein [Candidatus Acidoferrum sp.]|nr:GspMb/PilO family protein [Candidatus Acidoferrum sp.]